MREPRSSSFTLGILGGGQLCKMFLEETARLDIKTAVLEDHIDAPAYGRTAKLVLGSWADHETVLTFGRSVDLITCEIEHIDLDALDLLAAEGKIVRPAPQIFRTVSDKTTQKCFFRDHRIPTAPFAIFPGRPSEDALGPLPKVWKAAKGGYDGRGVAVLTRGEQLDALPDVPCLIEAFVADARELAVLVARRPSGQTAIYEPVEMVFDPEANLLDLLRCPASLPPDRIAAAEALARRTAEAFGLEGVMAVEMFLAPDGTLLVNEVAPRPHNSGHHTIESHVTSQYAQHLRAILDLPLGSTAMHCPAVMLNLVGGPRPGRPVIKGLAEALALDGVSVHIYGKAHCRPNRKMGHVTVLAPTIEDALAKARQLREILEVNGSE